MENENLKTATVPNDARAVQFPVKKTSRNDSEFSLMAEGMTLAQMEDFKAKALEVTQGLRDLEAMAGGPEPLSDYIGMSYSALADDYLENLACALDSRIEYIKEAMKHITYFQACMV